MEIRPGGTEGLPPPREGLRLVSLLLTTVYADAGVALVGFCWRCASPALIAADSGTAQSYIFIVSPDRFLGLRFWLMWEKYCMTFTGYLRRTR